MHLTLVLSLLMAKVTLLVCLSANCVHRPSALCCSKFTPTEEFMTLPGDIARTEFRLVATYQVGDTLALVAMQTVRAFCLLQHLWNGFIDKLS